MNQGAHRKCHGIGTGCAIQNHRLGLIPIGNNGIEQILPGRRGRGGGREKKRLWHARWGKCQGLDMLHKSG